MSLNTSHPLQWCPCSCLYLYTSILNCYSPRRPPSAVVYRAVTPDVPGSHRKPEDKERTLPWWTLLIGWFLVTLSILVPAFFVILYSMDWGPEISNAWLTAYFLSFFESIVLCEPLKVILGVIIQNISSK